MNPKDMVNDAIHNFHPQYQQYTQQGINAPKEDMEYKRDQQYQQVIFARFLNSVNVIIIKLFIFS